MHTSMASTLFPSSFLNNNARFSDSTLHIWYSLSTGREKNRRKKQNIIRRNESTGLKLYIYAVHVFKVVKQLAAGSGGGVVNEAEWSSAVSVRDGPAQSSDHARTHARTHAPVAHRVAARVDISMRMVTTFSQRPALLRLWDEDEHAVRLTVTLTHFHK